MSGVIIVITGVTRIDRDDLTNILKGLGAKVTGSVSKKTTYLLAGEVLEDGRPVNESSKFRKAQDLSTKIINFEELQDIVRVRSGNQDLDLENLDWKNSKPLETLKQAEVKIQNEQGGNNAKSFLKPSSENDMDIDDSKNTLDKNFNSNLISKSANDSSELWTTKYNPKAINEIIGNNSIISKITNWLQDWNYVHILGNKKEIEKTSKNSRWKNENVNAKALLISGDPGIGKTSTVRLLANILGFRLFELNASDQRNKRIILNKVGYLTDNTTLESKPDEKINQKNLILMDEIDGMAGNEDRGGVAALIQIIKNTKIPIICICNDRQSQKLRSLTNYCYDIKFSKPDKRQVTKRLIEICNSEGLKVEGNAIENLCESVGNDIRQSLNFLQFWSRKFSELKFFDMKNNFNKFLGCFKDKTTESLEKIFKSSNHISFSDLIDKRIRSRNEWNLLQDKGIHSSVAVGQYASNFLGFPKFPEYYLFHIHFNISKFYFYSILII